VEPGEEVRRSEDGTDPGAPPGDGDAEVADPAADGGPDSGGDVLGTRFERIRKHSVAGVMMSGIALGLQEALGPVKQETAVVFDVSGEPPGPPGPIEVQIDFEHPERTVAIIRPWLIADTATPGAAADTAADGSADHSPDGSATDSDTR
jgi:hypothetical protein